MKQLSILMEIKVIFFVDLLFYLINISNKLMVMEKQSVGQVTLKQAVLPWSCQYEMLPNLTPLLPDS